VDSIALVAIKSSGGSYGQAKVRITDLSGASVSGASVTGAWTGVVTGSVTATTDANGYATLASKKSKRSGTLTFTVKGLSKTGCVYSSGDNKVTVASVTL
jgi:subtilisin